MESHTAQKRRRTGNFVELEREYFERCKARFAQLDTLVAKWACEDLVPELSDEDFRLILGSSVGVEDLIELDKVVNAVHSELCSEFPHWKRQLEHPPGLVLTWRELYDPALYHPESHLWRAARGDAEQFGQYQQHLAETPWQPADERYFLDRFLYFLQPYQAELDLAVNVEGLEHQYAWHSRAMHYFAPAVQAAVSLIEKRAVKGKLEALRKAQGHLPDEKLFGQVLELIDNRYAGLDAPVPPFDDRLFTTLNQLKRLVFAAVSVVDINADTSRDTARVELAKLPVEPIKVLFNGIRFARLRKGRFGFYLDAPAHFDTPALLESDLRKWTTNMLVHGLNAYSQVRLGRPHANLNELIDTISPSLVSPPKAGQLRSMYDLCTQAHSPDDVPRIVRQILTLWDDVHRVVEKLFEDARHALCQ